MASQSPPDIYRLLGNLEAKVDILLERAAENAVTSEKDRERISKIEHEITSSKAIAGVISAVVAFLATGIVGYFTKQ